MTQRITIGSQEYEIDDDDECGSEAFGGMELFVRKFKQRLEGK